jgi:ACS family tartrate transporter-like MFS transporter
MKSFNGDLGLHSWRWMFIIEGVPAILVGASLLALLTDRPHAASWLSVRQRNWLQHRLSIERAAQETDRPFNIAAVVMNRQVWTLGALFACALVGIYGMLIWIPQIVNKFGHLSLIEVAILSALPPLLGVIGTLAISYSSDRTGDRKYHLAVLHLVGGLSLGASVFTQNPIISYAPYSYCRSLHQFWQLPFCRLNASLMTGVAAALSIAFMNAIAQLGGLVGPWIVDVVRERTDNFTLSLFAMACFLLLASIIAAPPRISPVPGATALQPILVPPSATNSEGDCSPLSF